MNASEKPVGLPTAVENSDVKLSRTRTWGSGLETRNHYTGKDVADLDYARDLGDPGQYPYTRGSYASMYRSKMWTIRAMFGYGAPEDTRDGVIKTVATGVKGIGIVVDSLGQGCIDPDHPAFDPEVGLDGLSLGCVRDVERLLDGIDITEVDVAWHMGPMAYALAAAVATKRGLPLEKLQGSNMPDLLAQSISCLGRKVYPPQFAHRMTVNMLEFTLKNSPKWAVGLPHGYMMRERGMTPVAEIAVGLAIARTTIDTLIARGMTIDEIAPKLAWVSVSDIDFLEEIGKFRALRRAWARTMKERYAPQDERSLRLRMSCHTGGRSLVYKQPLNNLSRVAIQTVAALLGGVQSLDCCTYDEPIGIPTFEARELAIRTQQIVANEVGVARCADPLGGSYYIESLTNEIESAALAMLADIEQKGIITMMEEGSLESMVDDFNFDFERDLDSGERVVVGLNRYLPHEDPTPRRFEFDPANTRAHIQRLTELKRTRNQEALADRLRAVFRGAQSSANSVPAIIDALLADASIGEVWGTLRMANGLAFDPYGLVQSPVSFT
jgi:methylmalonyl-CoA mutase, N-terminal domain